MPPVADVASVAGRFGRRLHDAGLPVSPDTSARFAAAIGLAPPATSRDLYWLARVTLVSEHAQLATFDRVFDEVFGAAGDPADWRGQARTASSRSAAETAGQPGPSRDGMPPETGWIPGLPPLVTAVGDRELTVGSDNGGGGRDVVIAAASADERLHAQDFSTLTGDEVAGLRTLMTEMALTAPVRRGRRKVRAPGGRHIDARATLRRARRTGGDPVDLIRRRRRDKPRRLVLLCDVSGSMQPYARVYLQLLFSGVGGARAEAFVFATRLTRLTPALRSGSPDAALARAARAAPDWSGGTRIGEAIGAFNDRYGRRGLARGAIVVILSDGWDCGDLNRLDREMGRLRRLAHRVIWVNPRSARVSFQPLTAGMAAALPHVDALRSGHSLDAMVDLLASIRADSWPASQPGRVP
jgi:uncharacterized protein with von Willebrand factor type A (vWA) domain